MKVHNPIKYNTITNFQVFSMEEKIFYKFSCHSIIHINVHRLLCKNLLLFLFRLNFKSRTNLYFMIITKLKQLKIMREQNLIKVNKILRIE